MLSSAVLVFIFTFTSFGVVLILGGIRFATLEVQIYYQAVNIFNLPLAAALSLVQISTMLVMMVIYTNTQKKLHLSLASSAVASRPVRSCRERLVVIVCVALISLLLFTPLLALIARSLFASGKLSFAGYTDLALKSRGSLLFIPPLAAILNSLRYALMAMVAALCLGLMASYMIHRRGRLSRLFDPLFMLPLATSAVTLGFGFNRSPGRTAAESAFVLVDHPDFAYARSASLCDSQRLAKFTGDTAIPRRSRTTSRRQALHHVPYN